jgi:hypothetical protein
LQAQQRVVQNARVAQQDVEVEARNGAARRLQRHGLAFDFGGQFQDLSKPRSVVHGVGKGYWLNSEDRQSIVAANLRKFEEHPQRHCRSPIYDPQGAHRR